MAIFNTLSMRFIVILIAFSLTACSGWRLRGSDTATTQLDQSVFLSGQISETYRLVETQLKRQNRLQSLLQAQLQVSLGGENISRRSVSVDSTSTTAEYQLTISINYTITSLSTETSLKRQLRISRDYRFDENDIAGKQREEQLIEKNLRRAAAAQILRQVQLSQR